MCQRGRRLVGLGVVPGIAVIPIRVMESACLVQRQQASVMAIFVVVLRDGLGAVAFIGVQEVDVAVNLFAFVAFVRPRDAFSADSRVVG